MLSGQLVPPASAAGDISARVTAARSGAVLQLSSGTYPALRVSGKHWTRTVTVRPLPGARVELAAVELRNVHRLRLEGVTVRGGLSGRAVRGLQVVRSALPSVDVRAGVTDLLLRDNRIDGRLTTWSATRGVTVYSHLGAGQPRNERILLEGNDIGWHTEDNVFLDPADDVLIRGNRIHDAGPASDKHQDGVQTMDSRRLRILGNEFWNQDEALMLKAETGLWPGAVVGPVTIADNVFRNSRGAGIILAGTSSTTVEHNTGWGNVHADLHWYRERDLRVRRNVFTKLWSASRVPPLEDQDNCVRSFGSVRDVAADPQRVAGRSRLRTSTPCKDSQGTWGTRLHRR